MDLGRALQSIVSVHSRIPDDAFTATTLGTERAGSGVVIRESGLVLTIGYLITEAEEIWLTDLKGRVTPGHPLAYDQETGFGLVQALGRLNLPAMPLGRSELAHPGEPVILAGGRGQTVQAHIVAKQEFAGYWEYLLDEAIFTAPAHPQWGGAGLIDRDGKLLGIGSLLMQQMTETGEQEDINMVVPIDLLPPILDDMLAHGQTIRPPRPWLGLFLAESDGEVIVSSLLESGPAATAGIRPRDVIASIADQPVENLAECYRKVWQLGPAGTPIPMELVRDGRSMRLVVTSADRSAHLKKPRLQ